MPIERAVYHSANWVVYWTAPGGSHPGPLVPAASFTVTAGAPGTFTFDGSASSEASGTLVEWLWDFGDRTRSVLKTDASPVTHSYAAAGNYTASLVVTDSFGTTASTTHPVSVAAVSKATAAFTLTSSVLSVNVNASTSTDTGSTISSYAWDFGDGATATGVTQSHTYAASGTYNITLLVTDALGSKSTVVHSVSVSGVPVAAFTASQAASPAFTINVDGSSSHGPNPISSYSWHWGDGLPDVTGRTATHTYASGGTYSVVLTVTDTLGKIDTQTNSVVVSGSAVNQPPSASFAASTTGLTANFDGSGSIDVDGSITAYAWNFGDGATATGVTASHTYATGATYNVTLTVTDNSGATGATTQAVTVAPTIGGWNPQGGPAGVQPHPSGSYDYATLSGANPSAKLDSVPVGAVVSLPPGTILFDDFAQATEAAFGVTHSGVGIHTTHPKQILGSGVGYTILKLNPGSTTKTTIPTNSTTRLEYWKAEGATLVQDLTLQGIPINGGYYTGPPHQVDTSIPLTENIYHGFDAHSLDNFTLRRVQVRGIPGTYYSPPGETFPITSYRGSNHLYEDCEMDGQNVSASGIGINYTNNVTVRRYYAHDSPYGIAITSYGAFGTLEIDDLWAQNYRAGVNLEANALSAIYIRNPKFDHCTDTEMTWWGNQYTQSSHSCRVELHDPVKVGGGKIRVRNPTYYGKDPNGNPALNNMLRSDWHVFINGVEVVATDYIQWL